MSATVRFEKDEVASAASWMLGSSPSMTVIFRRLHSSSMVRFNPQSKEIVMARLDRAIHVTPLPGRQSLVAELTTNVAEAG
jgi:hypothetical protein